MTALNKFAAVIAILFAVVGSCETARAAPPRDLDAAPNITEVFTLQQHWSDRDARRFYNLPQGSQLVPYGWFLHLEQPDSTKPFRDADHIRRLGYLPRTPGAVGNPDGLPIGFTEDGAYLGFTCAACHTAQITYANKAWLIDGAPGQGDIELLLRRLVGAIDSTVKDPAKFDRFAIKILGAGTAEDGKEKLKKELLAGLQVRTDFNFRNLPQNGSTPFGPGRTCRW